MEGCESKMRDNYVLGPEALVMVQGSSKGAQPKYYQDGYWYKVNAAGYEGKSEELVSKVLSCSNVKKYVTYEQCMINGKAGCRSKNFLGENESFISFQRLFDIYEGGDLTALILSRLVDTFISKISLTMLPVPKPHNTACVLSWEEARRWQSRSSGYSSS